jgi:electron transfer flavoprotein beta subunit
MKVLVPIKRVIDPYTKIRVRKDQKGVETEHLKMVINPFDEIALEEAIRWKEAGIITEIEVLSIGPIAIQETLRNGLALGADRATHIQVDTNLTPLAVAKCLKAFIDQHEPDIVIMGKQAIDDDCNQTGQMLAGLLNWPQATFASKIAFSADKKTVDVTREIDGGLETLTLELPVIITTDLRLNEPRYPTLPNIMKAKSKPLTVIPIDTLSVDVSSQIRVLEVMPPSARAPGKKVKDTAELLHYLRDIEKVIT